MGTPLWVTSSAVETDTTWSLDGAAEPVGAGVGVAWADEDGVGVATALFAEAGVVEAGVAEAGVVEAAPCPLSPQPNPASANPANSIASLGLSFDVMARILPCMS